MNTAHESQKFWVVFSGETDLAWLRILKRGFRHCFIVMRDGDHWMTFDPMAHYTELNIHNVSNGFDLKEWFENQGFYLVPACKETPIEKPMTPAFFTCVEAVKRVLGIRSPFIVTPWQLYQFLKFKNNKENNNG